ncbi:MAG: c-type cytochrome [Phycisphaeraceae bacterium]
MPRISKYLDLDMHLPRPPRWMIVGLLALVVLSWIPLVLAAYARVGFSQQPRVHLFQDMDNQAKIKPQEYHPIFRDERGMRPPVPGTIAWGPDIREPSDDALQADDHYYRGYRRVVSDDGQPAAEYFEGFPDAVEVDEAFVERGRTQFNVFCATCHGLAGQGDGPVSKRAELLAERGTPGTQWVRPSDVTDPRYGPGEYSEGRLYSVIARGVRSMPSYGSQIPPKDRWAIVAYVRALQLSQRAPLEMLTPEERAKLR